MSAAEEHTQLSELEKALRQRTRQIVAVNVTSKLTQDGPILEIVVVEEVCKSDNHPFKGWWGFVRAIFAAFMLFIILAALFLGFGLISLVICVLVAIFREEKRNDPDASGAENLQPVLKYLCPPPQFNSLNRL